MSYTIPLMASTIQEALEESKHYLHMEDMKEHRQSICGHVHFFIFDSHIARISAVENTSAPLFLLTGHERKGIRELRKQTVKV